MTAADARYAVELLDALRDLTEVRAGLKDSNYLEIVSLEGDSDGGTHHGAALLPLESAPTILDFVEKYICDELLRLDVQP